jgi:hypothetical protein
MYADDSCKSMIHTLPVTQTVPTRVVCPGRGISGKGWSRLLSRLAVLRENPVKT